MLLIKKILCWFHLHTYRFYKSDYERSVESFINTDLVRLDGISDKITTYCIPIKKKCLWCGKIRQCEYFENYSSSGQRVYEIE